MFEAGTIISGKYRIDRVIGRGGMGIVAVATHLQLDQQFAIKVLHEIYAHDETSRDRFLREARTPMRLKSDHVCRVHDVGTLDSGEPYIVMELLVGSDLASQVQRQPLPPPIAVDYILQAMIAIAEAHALGIVHRDLKPANLFVTRRIDGSPLVKVLDFGIAKAPATSDNRLTHTTAVMGSPGYMSPEQLRSARDVDARADIWALGAILYELMSGRVPFPATSVTELAMKVAVDPPAPLDIHPAVHAVVWRCLEKDLTKRYQDVGALAHDLAPLGSPGAAATAALIARLVGAGSAATMASIPPPIVAGNAATVASTTLGAAAGSHTQVPRAAKQRWWLPIGVGVVAIAVATIAGIAASKHDEHAAGGSAAVPSDAAVVAVAVDAKPHEEREFTIGAVATATAGAQRAADLIGHPPALEHHPAKHDTPPAKHDTPPVKHDAPPDAAVVAPPIVEATPPAIDAGVVDPHDGVQFDAFIMNGRCTAAAKIIGRAGATAERQAALADCKTRLQTATHHPEAPESEKYLLGLVADSPAQAETTLNNFFFRAVLYDCDQHDIPNARKALSHLTTKRQAAIDTCLSRNGMTIP